jgi:hypothetical protein
MRERVVRVLLIVLGAVALELGVWATLAPRSFYDDFPGLGRMWVAVDGPYNEHLVRDFGGLNLALAVLTFAAALSLSLALVRTAAVAWLVWGVPHLVYHARHLDPFSASDKVLNLGALAGAVAAALVVLALARPLPLSNR